MLINIINIVTNMLGYNTGFEDFPQEVWDTQKIKNKMIKNLRLGLDSTVPFFYFCGAFSIPQLKTMVKNPHKYFDSELIKQITTNFVLPSQRNESTRHKTEELERLQRLVLVSIDSV